MTNILVALCIWLVASIVAGFAFCRFCHLRPRVHHMPQPSEHNCASLPYFPADPQSENDINEQEVA
ncbi:MAG: hypothetical protein JRI89_17445 [Deltaproteobacteria bacterium]|nr:hypothetical protein [Deltaproteobacteria bacterium]